MGWEPCPADCQHWGSSGWVFASKTSAALRFGMTSAGTHPAPLVLGGLQTEMFLSAGSGS